MIEEKELNIHSDLSDENETTKEEFKNPSSFIESPKFYPDWNFDKEKFDKKLKYFIEVFHSEKSWKKYSNKNGIEIKTYEGKGNLSGIFGTIKLPYNNEVILEVVKKTEEIFKINNFADEIKILEKYGERTIACYMKFKGMLMVSGRDFIVWDTQTYMIDHSEKGIFDVNYKIESQKVPIIVSYSIEHPEGPVKAPKGIVRGEIVRNFYLNDLDYCRMGSHQN